MSRREAADQLLEEYFEPYALPKEDGPTETGIELERCLRKLEKRATKALKSPQGAVEDDVEDPLTKVPTIKDAADDGGASDSSHSISSSESEDDGMHERILELFHRFDVNRDGLIELEELTNVMQQIDCRKWTHQKVSNLMAIMDVNKDRQVSYEEFVDWICGSCRWRKERRQFFKELGVNTGDLQAMKDAVAERGQTIRGSILMWQ